MDFLREQGYDVEKIDYSRKNYLEQYDVALIEQNGFNDYIENDELYIRGSDAGGFACSCIRITSAGLPVFCRMNWGIRS